MVIKRFPLLLLTLIGVNCNRDGFGEPIPVPEHPAFILRSVMDEDRITVVDLDEEKIVGYRQVVEGQYVVEDFAVSPDNLIFLPVSWFKIAVDDGKCVLVADIESEKLLKDSITTSLWPTYIYPFLNRTKAFLCHPGVLWGDTDVVTTELDLVNREVIKALRSQGVILNVLSFGNGATYLLYVEWGSSGKQFIQRFEEKSDSQVGESIYLNSPPVAIIFAVVVDAEHFAAPTSRGQGPDVSSDAVAIFDLSGNQVEVIPVGEDVRRLLYHDNKLYVCHNTGGLMKHGNHNKVSVIDLESKSVIKTIEVCNAPVDIAYSEATDKIVVVSGVGTVITIIDPVTDSVINTIVSDEVGDVDEWGYDRLRIPE